MELSEDVLKRLGELVAETTALVYVDGEPNGTAFFITEDLLLTCEHVVPEDKVTIQPYLRKSRPAEVVRRAEGDIDLALLRSPPDSDEPSPCVVLGEGVDSYECLVAGYPVLKGTAPGYEPRAIRVHWRTDPATGSPQILVIDPGQIITGGMSGSPVISTATGTVVAIVRTSRDTQDALGGGAIPVSVAAEAFPHEVGGALDGETWAMIRWRNALGRDNWQRLGRSWPTANRVDLWIKGDHLHWDVRLLPAGGHDIPHKGPDLYDGIAKAIFLWAQRRHVRGTDEVRLLGQLLARALFPSDIPPELRALTAADSLLVCLHVEKPGNNLADIPWELAADPFSDDLERFLATDGPFQFIRITADHAEQVPGPVPKPPDNVRVLTVVAQPADWVHPDIPTPSGGRHPWPDAKAIRARLEAAIHRSGLDVTPLAPATRGNMQDELRARTYDVLHYMGTGRKADGRPEILFVDDSEPESELEEWADVHSVLTDAARAGVRFVVLELMLPPEDKDFQQLTCSTFGDVVTGTVMAVVLTNLPVYPDQCQVFDREFYRSLGGGASIEEAVQEARCKLKADKPTGDAAGFGWFTVVTGRQTGIRLAAPELRDPNVPSPRAAAEPPEAGTSHVCRR